MVKKSSRKKNGALTPRETEVLEFLYLKGKQYDEAARALFISTETVRTHAHKIYAKLKVKNCVQAGLKYFGNGKK